VTDDAILPHYFTLVIYIYSYLSHFDEFSSNDESSGDKMYPLRLSADGTRAASGEHSYDLCLDSYEFLLKRQFAGTTASKTRTSRAKLVRVSVDSYESTKLQGQSDREHIRQRKKTRTIRQRRTDSARCSGARNNEEHAPYLGRRNSIVRASSARRSNDTACVYEQ
jgi:hypothetical protein